MSGFEPIPDAAPSAPPARYPFWGYQDLALFAGLAVPSLLLAFGLVQAVILVSGLHPAGKAGPLMAGQFLGYGFLFLSLYGLLKLRYGRPFWASLGWVRPRAGLWTSVFGGPVLALLVAVLGLALQTPEMEMPIKDLLTDRFSITLVALFATTLGPLCEELAFRGFLLPLVSRSLGRAVGVLIAAMPFAILHAPQYSWSWRHILLIALAGTVFGWMRLWSRSTIAATLMHAGYNLTFFSAYLFQGKDLPTKW
ncbi:MAG: type II CAAX endopeptidase family protein [Bryobacterales bacterium]|nr:type II CAAX endopeptidase family protein [Bryobacterales bacterium]